ncbi:hypothetical protein ACFXKR_11030 [Streptomyces violascens]|uniref:hypothetical protein n=1 Tax=Streptomyces violascens TaxID=67381 RepID=UPI00368DD7D5
MVNGEQHHRKGTPTSHMNSYLALVAQLTEQAEAGLAEESDTARIFMTLYSGFLFEAGAGIRCLLDPSLIEQATVAVRRQAPTLHGPARDLAGRLLAAIWASGILAGVDTDDWIRNAPELPAICLRMAALFEEDPMA